MYLHACNTEVFLQYSIFMIFMLGRQFYIRKVSTVWKGLCTYFRNFKNLYPLTVALRSIFLCFSQQILWYFTPSLITKFPFLPLFLYSISSSYISIFNIGEFCLHFLSIMTFVFLFSYIFPHNSAYVFLLLFINIL
jgi:hypothetical protein